MVRRTIAAQAKEKRYQRIFKVMLAGALVLAFLALLPAINHLSQVLKPVNEVAAQAKECLDRAKSSEPYGVDYTYELIDKIEQTRTNLRESRWLMRFLLQGGGQERDQSRSFSPPCKLASSASGCSSLC